MTEKTIRILLADDHEVLRDGVDSVLEKPMFLRLIQTLVTACQLRM